MASTLVTCGLCGVENSTDCTVCHICGAALGTLTVPHHLTPLLLPTPSGVAKLLAAWDGLSTESQILILTKVKEPQPPRPAYLSKRIHLKALDSANAYVRYLAASSLRSSGDEVFKGRIEQDPDTLVRYCPLETPETAFYVPDKLKDADTFFALPHEARLALVRSRIKDGEQIAQLVTHAIDHQLKEGGVSEIDLFEILCDYVKKPSFRGYYDSGRDDWNFWFFEMRDIRALWNIVPKLSEAISYVLIENLPAILANESAIPDEVPKQLNLRQVEKLLYRSDVGLEKFRKDTFWACEATNFMTRLAATSHNFNLDFTEFSRILDLPKKEKAESLGQLSSGEDLSLFLYEVIADAYLVSDENAVEELWIGKERAKAKQVSRLKSRNAFTEFRALGLYRLARSVVPWTKEEQAEPLKGDLAFLSKFVVQGDTWRTFVSFHEVWTKQKPNTIAELLEYLPEWTRPPQDPEELFGDAGREGNFLEDKIDFIGKKLLSLSDTTKTNENTSVCEDPGGSIAEKEESESLEQKIDSIKTKLLFYEEKFEIFCKELRYILWTVIIVFAISYGWKFVARLV